MPRCKICRGKIAKAEVRDHLKKCYLEDKLGLNIWCGDGLEYLENLDVEVNLILTDPPYIISHSTGMDTHYVKIAEGGASKTEEEWLKFSEKLDSWSPLQHKNYLKYGSIYGRKYAVRTDYGEWDSEFTMNLLDKYIELYYKKLCVGGTLIIFFDLWKITLLKELLEKHNFKQIRMIEWIKTNPQPLNSKVNYLTNCREIALVAVKGSRPTFNSSYDNGLYFYPIQSANRFHPTQKSLKLFEDLVAKHSLENDIVLDTFLGGGTTATACKNLGRRFYGCEISAEYYEKIINNLLEL